jgi:WD40 repeat protein
VASESDLYGLQNLARHLSGNADGERLDRLLGDFGFLHAKLATLDVPALLADYEYLAIDSPLRSVQAAVRLAAEVLGRDPAQLAGQLLGRLPPAVSHPALASLVAAAQSAGEHQLVPVTSSLSPAQGALRQSLHLPAGTRGLAMTSDGRYVLSCGRKHVWIWDLTGARPLRSFTGHRHRVTSVAVSPDDRWLISADQDGTLIVWDFESRRLRRSWQGHQRSITQVIALPDGRRFLSAGVDGLIKLWDLWAETELQVSEGLTDGVVTFVGSPAGARVLSSSRDGTVQVWDLDSNRPPRQLGRLGQPVGSLGGEKVVFALTGGLVIRDLATGDIVRTLAGPERWSNLAVSPDGRLLAVLVDSAVAYWDLAAGKELGRSGGGLISSQSSLAFSPNGSALVTAGGGVLRVWEVRTTEGSEPDPEILTLAITSDGCLVVLGLRDGSIVVRSLPDCREVCRFTISDVAAKPLLLTPDGEEVVAGDRKGRIHRFNLARGERLAAVEGFEVDNGVCALGWLDGGQYLVAGSVWGDILVWKIDEARLVCEHRIAPGYLITLAVIPGTRRVVIVQHNEEDQSPFVLDLQDGRRLRPFRGHRFAVYAVAVSADGRFVVTGSDDWGLKIWDVEGQGGERSLRGHRDRVTSVVLTQDGRFAVSCSTDRTVKLWDLQAARCLSTFTGDRGLTCCALSSDGRTIVAGGISGDLHVLRWNGQELSG